MRVLLSWLREWIDLPETAEEIALVLTKVGIEVDKIELIRPPCKQVVVAKIQDVRVHPTDNSLSIATIFDGTAVHHVVCGAKNVKSNQKTAFAPLGATVIKNGQPHNVQAAVIQTVESCGFLCSEKELGLTSYEGGIIELDDSLTVGELIAQHFSDTLLELSLTPNLGHCLSVMGIARELAAFLQRPLKKMPRHLATAKQNDGPFSVRIVEKKACPRYSALLVENVHVGPSPLHLRLRLERSGIRSLFSIVDITNYVALDIGEPLHAFDADKIQGNELIVRFAAKDETLHLLDGDEKRLTQEVLLIADKQQPLAAAGVMGGQESGVSESTTRVIFESAFFNPQAIRRSKRALGVQTDSAKRFERGTDPAITLSALAEVLALLPQDIKVSALQDTGPLEKRASIICRRSKTSSLLGFEVSTDEIESTFRSFGFTFVWDGQDTFEVEPPSYRHDLQEEVDLIEEIGKCIGLSQERTSPLSYSFVATSHDPMYQYEQKICHTLIAQGLQEVITCDLISPELASSVINHPITQESLVKILNPTSIEQSILRPSLLPGLIDVARRNQNSRIFDFFLFEVGHVHFKKEDKYEEPSLFACLLSGALNPHHYSEKRKEGDFFDLKGVLESVFTSLDLSEVHFETSALSILHPGRQAKIIIEGAHIGMIGQLHPALLRMQGIEKPLYFAECDIHELFKLRAASEKKMKPLVLYPASERDWTITCSKNITFDDFKQTIEKTKIAILESYQLIDMYENEKLGTDVHNVTFRFVYREKEKTILQEDVEKAHALLLDKLTQHLLTLR